MKDQKENKNYKAIIQVARSLFWKHGFRRVTINEICREAKTSKMTFYRFFPNKLELARTVLDQVFDKSVQDFRIMMREDSTVSVKMKKMLLMKLEGTNDISNEFLQDFYNNPELGLTSYIEERSRAIWTEIIKDFKIAQEEGWIRKDLKVEFLYYFIHKISALITDSELLKLYNSPQELIMEMTNMFVYGIDPTK